LRGDAQDVRRGAVVVHQRDTIRRGVLAFLPVGKALQEKFEAAKGRATEAVDGLIVVADHHDIPTLGGEQVQKFELSDVGVLKFVHQDVLKAFL